MPELLQSNLTILVVEDDPGDFGLIRVQVRLAGFGTAGAADSVRWAKTLAEGLAAARLEAPDVVLLDLSLPDSAGIETVRTLRRAAPALPIIVLTGSDEHSLAAEALEAGAQDFLVKGQVDQDGLRRAVRNSIVRRKLEVKVALNEQRFQDFSSAASDWWFWEMDAELRFSYFSSNAALVIGRSMDGLLGQRREDLAGNRAGHLQAGQRRQWADHLDDLAQRRAFHQFEYCIDVPDGKLLWLSISGVPIVDADGRFLGYRGTGTNITERKLADEKLNANERILGAAIQAIDEAFVLYDSDDRLVFCNEKYRSLYAVSYDLLTPGTTFEHTIREGARRGQYPEAIGRIDEWVAERLAVHRRSNSTLIQKLDSGHWVRIVERKTSDGNIVGFRVDVTELQLAKEAAEAASAAKSLFLASMSHELRTPMNGVLGMLELVTDTPLTAEQGEYVALAQNSARGLLTLLNDILDFAKIEAGRMGLERVAFEPRGVLAEAVQTLAIHTREKRLEVELQIDERVPQVLIGDPTRLRQIIINLLGNAIKFTAQGRIVVGAAAESSESEADGTRVTFSVSDTGIGIAAEQLRTIFEAFSQADASTTRQFGGTGLGLAICSRLAALMGGRIWVDSEPGRGSIFRFSALFGRSDGAIESVPTAPAEDVAPMAALRILLAEDNPTNQKFALTVLGKAGHAVTLAEDGEAAVAKARAEPFDIILMDIEMPRLDGFGATRAIRAGGIETPIIALTAHAIPGFREQCLVAGMTDYLSKPFRSRDLQSKLAEVLGRPPARTAETGSAGAAAHPLPMTDNQSPVLDTAAALDRMDGDISLLLMILPAVCEQMSQDRVGIAAAANERDAPRLKKASHRLKGSVASIGAVRVQEACARLEAAATSGDCDAFGALLCSLEAEQDTLAMAIADYLANHRAADT